ncbi:MAG: EpsI family protein [Deltaproteobacteria bacterium]|nr:EpsI family protein [Deltaproteobacteria bacterium]
MKKSNLYFSVIFILLIGVFFYSRSLSHPIPVPLVRNFSTFPDRIGKWQSEEIPLKPAVLKKLGADAILNRAYHTLDGQTIWLYIGYYRTQQNGTQIHSPLHCYPGSGWTPVRREVVAVPVGDRKIHINRMIIENGTDKRLVAYWYQADNRVIANEYLQRFDLIRRALQNNRTNGALVRISMPIEKRPEQQWRTLQNFLLKFYPYLLEWSTKTSS